MNSKKEENDWSNVVLVNLACLVAGFIISITFKLGVFGLSLTFFVTSMIDYAISSRSSKNYLAWDRMGLFCLITSFIMLILAFFDLLSNLH